MIKTGHKNKTNLHAVERKGDVVVAFQELIQAGPEGLKHHARMALQLEEVEKHHAVTHPATTRPVHVTQNLSLTMAVKKTMKKKKTKATKKTTAR
jgi:hypothetical protein